MRLPLHPSQKEPPKAGMRPVGLEGRAGWDFTWTMSRSASFPREDTRTSSPSSSTIAVGARKGWVVAWALAVSPGEGS